MPVRRGGAMTSSSSADSAEDPSLPLGLGDRRLGEPEPDPEVVDVSPAGRAMGAMGRATGPGSPMDRRFDGLACIICVGELRDVPGAPGALDGGPIGWEGAGIARKAGSKGGPMPKLRGTAEGANGGGGGCIEGPG